jgi:hypothetical protein
MRSGWLYNPIAARTVVSTKGYNFLAFWLSTSEALTAARVQQILY